MSKSHSSGLLDDPDDENYEYMNKQTCVTPVSLRHNRHSKHNTHRMKMNKKQTSSLSSVEVTPYVEVREGHTRNNHSSDSEQQGSQAVEYEYMDIRVSDKEESPTEHDDPPPPPPPPTQTGMGEEVEHEEEDEYVEAEDSNYHYTNRQPKLRQALQDKKELKMQGKDEGEAYEYEDMDCFASVRPGDEVVYQNMRRQVEGAVGGSEAHKSAFEPYVKVRAGVGVGEPAAVDRSFDNPDYWHSRMFMKPNAVPT